MRVRDLDTPLVTVHLDVMEDNIRRVQAHLDRHGIGNRAHIKTHKIPAIGRLQLDGGASEIDRVEVIWPVVARGKVR
jgi:D-serine deaminase-like pyridoxal phosphate-dependent protein